MADEIHAEIDLRGLTPANRGLQVGMRMLVPVISQIANDDDIPAAERHHVFGGALTAQVVAMREAFGDEATLQVVEELKKLFETSSAPAPSMH